MNHLSYADDMVLMSPSVKGLQLLLNICGSYALNHDIIYSTDKSYCMICWPKHILYKFIPRFYLQDDLLEFVTVYKYLGVLINNRMSDDDELRARMRGIYSTGNMVIRKFGKCSLNCKILMFKTFLSQLYACSLWSSYKVASYYRVKVAHNDVFRTLINVPRYESASTQFVAHGVPNLDVVLRRSYFSLMSRVLKSTNTIVSALVSNEPRLHSRLWHRWGLALGRDMVIHF